MTDLISGMMVIKNAKVQKAKMKEDFLPIVWHPSRYWDCCMPEDEKKR